VYYPTDANFLIRLGFSYNPPMHIGVLTHNYPRFPGDFSGTFVQALCEEFARQAQQVTVWAPFDPAYLRNTQYTIRNTDPIDNAAQPIALGQAAQSINLSLYRYIWPDRWHQLGYMRSMQSDLALRLNSYLLSPGMFAAGIAHVWREAKRVRPNLLHAHWLLPNGFMAAVVSRRLGIPLVISVPGSDAQVAGKNPLFRAMARFALRQADLLTANSAELRDAVIAIARQGDPTLGQAVAAKFDLILYGTDPNALKPDPIGVAELRTQLGIDTAHSTFHTPHSALILCVGRMVYKKGFDIFIRALATEPLRQRSILGIMVGNGDQKAEWQALAQQLGVADRLRWVGNIPKTEIGLYYNACDLLLNPSVSRPADGLNVCVLDA
jgi:glycosyltransferase involved in cell wall biosynthesis